MLKAHVKAQAGDIPRPVAEAARQITARHPDLPREASLLQRLTGARRVTASTAAACPIGGRSVYLFMATGRVSNIPSQALAAPGLPVINSAEKAALGMSKSFELLGSVVAQHPVPCTPFASYSQTEVSPRHALPDSDLELTLSATRSTLVGHDFPFNLRATLPHTAHRLDLDPVSLDVPAPAHASHITLIIVHAASMSEGGHLTADGLYVSTRLVSGQSGSSISENAGSSQLRCLNLPDPGK